MLSKRHEYRCWLEQVDVRNKVFVDEAGVHLAMTRLYGRVFGNLKVHYATLIKSAIEAVGAHVVFLPPYLPDLSPIELCWSKLKHVSALPFGSYQ